MNVLVLMAGRGDRFLQVAHTDPRFQVPKPLIPVKGRTILEWTMESFPYVDARQIRFAVRKDHLEDHNVEAFLKARFGERVSITSFDEITRGNLETAYIASQDMVSYEPLFILDSDNAYYHNDLLGDLLKIQDKTPSAAVCYFRAKELEPKWAFVRTNEAGFVDEIAEKDPDIIQRGGLPLVGTFYFDSVKTFRDIAYAILRKGEMSGPEGKREFFVSQAIRRMVLGGLPVLGHEVTDVVPLGTPEDVKIFEAAINEQTTHLH